MRNLLSKHFRLLRKLAVDSSCAKTRSAEPACTFVHEDSSIESTKQIESTLAFPKKSFEKSGFTLLEVLIALAILGIALTAALNTTAHAIITTQSIRDRAESHWVAMNAVSMIQLKLVTIQNGQTLIKKSKLLGHVWYWRANIQSTPFKQVEKIIIDTSPHQDGPFQHPLIAYRTLAHG